MEGLFFKRIKKEMALIKEHKQIICEPVDDNFKLFHFTFKGE